MFYQYLNTAEIFSHQFWSERVEFSDAFRQSIDTHLGMKIDPFP